MLIILAQLALWRNAYFSLNFDFIDANTPTAQSMVNYNTQIITQANEWLASLPFTEGKNVQETQLSILDTMPVWTEVLDNPERFGAPNATCMSQLAWDEEEEGNGCLWTDSFHPGRALNRAVAEELRRVLVGMGFWRR